MRLLLDTHALLWWLSDSDDLGQQARALIADPGNDVLVSVASLWEIVVKVRIGKLQADIEDIDAALARDQFVRLDIRPAHLAVLGGLPKHPDHRDPFDHLLIAQAISEDATFVSEDRHAPRYPVRVATCSDPAA
ncbi:type II toxin-antitoxin system VapC family toxin [Methylobacterium sp. J-072]|uniref:type II toxin-antitoxin system VapC family toxin n=1 Tax=Methylobacterium sp. J-072 TaxID=2836651 RepID=UPI001FB953D0|nr:type II toxin-antitoxin system VapC family toxin [Methylobacterium sp. J-072]MCJ2092461.1 type II toxin-antitoxin system VapC family toxin [Methylobacterium sp. J-072]